MCEELRQEAEQMALEEYCQVTCKGMGRCCDYTQCEGFKQEVEYIVKEWATEDAGEQPDENG